MATLDYVAADDGLERAARDRRVGVEFAHHVQRLAGEGGQVVLRTPALRVRRADHVRDEEARQDVEQRRLPRGGRAEEEDREPKPPEQSSERAAHRHVEQLALGVAFDSGREGMI
jgi:hypothetical protein